MSQMSRGRKRTQRQGPAVGVACISSIWCGWCVSPAGHQVGSTKEASLPIPSPRSSPPGWGPQQQGLWVGPLGLEGSGGCRVGGGFLSPHPAPRTSGDHQCWEACPRPAAAEGEDQGSGQMSERRQALPWTAPSKTPGPKCAGLRQRRETETESTCWGIFSQD